MKLETMNGEKKNYTVNLKLPKLNGIKQPSISNVDKEAIGSLPVKLVQEEVLQAIRENEICIIIGETGSGKSTQIPQICLDSGLHLCSATGQKKKIVVTQPRRIAAHALAKRVAAERNSQLGQEVGFKYRFENNTTENTRIIYATDGIMLADMCIHDPFFTDYSIVIVDEAHERSTHTDMLLMMLRLLFNKKKKGNIELPLKLIIMSATMEAEKFSKFFHDAKIFAIEGRSYETKLYHLPVANLQEGNMVTMCVDCVLQLDETEPKDHDFLVFLPGSDEINSAVKLTSQRAKDKGMSLVAFPLYASLSFVRQNQIYQKLPKVRKVIYSTNIAETSVTIPGIRVVIDSGKVRQKMYMNDLKYDKLVTVNVSQAQAMQRAGRAGREAPGKCYRLFSLDEYNKMSKMPVPEILRTNLASFLLTFFKIGLRKPRALVFLDEPPRDKINSAVVQLRKAGLIRVASEDKKGYECTKEGSHLASFPVDPFLGQILFKASKNKCLVEAITVLSFLSSESVFTQDEYSADDRKSVELRRKFHSNEGDHARMIAIYKFYKSSKGKAKSTVQEDLSRFGINEARVAMVFKVRKQLHKYCQDADLSFASCNNDYSLVRKSIAEALPHNICIFDPEIKAYRVVADKKVVCKIHPQSCLSGVRVNAMVFTSLVETTECYAKDVSLVDPSWIKD